MKKLPAVVLVSFLLASELPFATAAVGRKADEGSAAAKAEGRATDGGRRTTDARPGMPMMAGTADTKDYLLQPQDVLKVQVYQEEDINRQGDVTISQEFTVFLPLIGTISMKGKTARQAEGIIRQLYDKDFLVNPQV